MAVRIFRHALQMIFGNFGNALKVSLGPIILGFVVIYLLFLGLLGSTRGLDMFQPGGTIPFAALLINPGQLLLTMVLSLIVVFCVLSWIAVAWHRFILLEEYPGVVPKVNSGIVWRYMWQTIKLVLIMVLPVILIVLPLTSSVSDVSQIDIGSPPTPSQYLPFLLINTLLGLLFSFVWFRLAITLPARAVENQIGIAEVWRTTAPLSGTIFGIIFILTALNIVVNSVVAPVFGGVPYVGEILNMVVKWLTVMIGVSVLTTMYGHLVQGRPLV